MKLKLLTSTILILGIFAGCSENTEDKTQEKKTIASSATPVIEVVKNDNAEEIKVREREKRALEIKKLRTSLRPVLKIFVPQSLCSP